MVSRRTYIASCGAVFFSGCLDTSDNSQPNITQTEQDTPETTLSHSDEQDTSTTTPSPSNNDGWTEINGHEVRMKEYNLKTVLYENRPQWYYSPYKTPHNPHSVEDAIEMPNLLEKTVYNQTGHHPMRTARVMGQFLHGFWETGDERFLTKAGEMSEALVQEEIVESDGAYFIKYGFDYSNSNWDLSAPWFSAMSQGVALSAHLRLWEFTNNQKHRDIADSIFQSFLNARMSNETPWVSAVDDSGYLWLEEYPQPELTHVLNGFVVALWGAYEYWLVTGDSTAKTLICAVLTTLEEHAIEYRNPEQNSWYSLNSLTNTQPAADHYHLLHMFQLRKLAEFAHEPKFERVQALFYQDNPLNWEDCTKTGCSEELEG